MCFQLVFIVSFNHLQMLMMFIMLCDHWNSEQGPAEMSHVRLLLTLY